MFQDNNTNELEEYLVREKAISCFKEACSKNNISLVIYNINDDGISGDYK